ncbi:AMP binding protein [Mycena galopus ATCC 62051]|nr:AMP binding protein [Mycena galopus ATCC 62051]
MAPRVYTSDISDVPIVNTSIFTRIFAPRGPSDIGGFPAAKSAFIDGPTGTSLTRAQIMNLALSFGYGIQDHPITAPFTRRGATALIYSSNSLAWPVVLFGCVAAGLRCTFANSAYVGRELAHQYGDSGAGLVITAENGIDKVRAMFHELGIPRHEGDRRTIVLGCDLRWAGKLEREEEFEGTALAQETVYLCYSSGTTGKPKGVETTHQNLTTVLDVVRPFFLDIRSGNGTTLCCIPFFHIYGLVLLLHLPFTLGWSVVIQSQFEPSKFCAAIERFKIPFTFIVPPVLVVLARHPVVDNYDLSSLEYMLSSAAPLGADLVKQVKARLLAKRPPGGSCLITQDRKIGSAGRLCANVEARIVYDDEGTVDAEKGAPGELWGYLNNRHATKNSITPDGWFKTGDIVIRDEESFFYVVDRKKELIKYKGFQVPPAELESVLLAHPDIVDVAVIGVESFAQATELPRAYVVHARPDEVASTAQKIAFAQGVAKWMESKIAKHKMLRGGVAIIDTIPKRQAYFGRCDSNP